MSKTYTSIFADIFWIVKVKQIKQIEFWLNLWPKCRPLITKMLLKRGGLLFQIRRNKRLDIRHNKYQPKVHWFHMNNKIGFWQIKTFFFLFLGFVNWLRLSWFYYKKISNPRELRTYISFFCAENYERVEWNLLEGKCGNDVTKTLQAIKPKMRWSVEKVVS